MDKAILYIHGKGGNPKEAEYYKALFEEYDVIGFDYSSQLPWEAKKEFPRLFDNLCGTYETVTVIANSIGAFFAMSALADSKIEKAYFISPVVDMVEDAQLKQGECYNPKKAIFDRATEEVNKQLKRQMILYKRRIKELELQIELLEEENQRLKENR